MLSQGKDPESFADLDEAINYYRQLYQADQTFTKLKKVTQVGKSGKKKRKRNSGEDSPDGNNTFRGDKKIRKNGGNKGKNNKYCKNCKKSTHNTSDCWFKDGKKKQGSGNGNERSQNNSKDMFTKSDFKAMMSNMVKAMADSPKSSKNGKSNKVSDNGYDTESSFDLNIFNKMDEEFSGDDNSDNTSNSDIDAYSSSNHCYCLNNVVMDIDMTTEEDHNAFPFAKRQKVDDNNDHKIYTTDVVVELKNRAGDIVPIRALLDTGTNATILLHDFVAKRSCKSSQGRRTKWKTLGGIFSTRYESLIDFKFPELSQNKTVTWTVHVDDKTPRKTAAYDMIIGMDLMCQLGINIDCADKSIKWEGNEIPMKTRKIIQDEEVMHMLYYAATTPEVLEEAEQRQDRILDADYSKIAIDPFVQELKHLSSHERSLLAITLKKFPTLFGGGLGELKIPPISLELIPGSKPYHSRPFPVPQSLEKTTKKEMHRLTDIGVFKKDSDSEWAAPTFIKPKKTGDVRILTDFRRLNACIKRKPFPLPKISDLLRKLTGFKWATAIDLSMGYYHIPLDKEAMKLCTTILPWGKYQYRKLPMGIKTSPDIFQKIMNDLLGDMPNVSVYLDDILITSDGSFPDHLTKVEAVLTRLQNANFRANLRKCFFGENKIEYLGYIISGDGIEPQPKKVEAICRLSPPKTKRQLRHFLGMVNYYRDLWRRRSHILSPLTGLVSPTTQFKWGKEQQDAFEEVKRTITEETLLAFPDFNKEFHIYTDASNKQLGAVIMQENKPLAFYSRKMNSAQTRYTTGEQELLSIVETLKEFKDILFGHKIVVHTDHQNILYGKLSNDRITRWRLLLEEFGPTYVHVSGKQNIVADALSRLEKEQRQLKPEETGFLQANVMSMMIRDESIKTPESKEEIARYCFNGNRMETEEFPLSPQLIAKEQEGDRNLRQAKRNNPNIGERIVEGERLLTLNNKVIVPLSLRERVLWWYHEYLQHPGQKRMEATIGQNLTWTNLRQDVDNYVKTCRSCQKNKLVRQKYGHIPTKEAERPVPWNRVNVDLIGPLTCKTPQGPKELLALTMIDPATGWFEVKDVRDKTATAAMEAFDDVWLSRYPRPQFIGFDNGSEYKGVFKELCTNYGIQPKLSLSYNPQSNGIVERVHLVLTDMLRTAEVDGKELDAMNPWGPHLNAAAYAIRSTYHTTLGATPAQLVFGRDMVLPIRFRADWAVIEQRRQQEMGRNNTRENAKRARYEYKIGDKVFLQKPGILRKLETPREGPYDVIATYTNGTIRIQKGPVSERVNIRRVIPSFE